MSENAYTPEELTRSIVRIEKSQERLETSVNKLVDSVVTERDLHVHLQPIRDRVGVLEDTQKWLSRLVISAVVLALLGIILVSPLPPNP